MVFLWHYKFYLQYTVFNWYYRAVLSGLLTKITTPWFLAQYWVSLGESGHREFRIWASYWYSMLPVCLFLYTIMFMALSGVRVSQACSELGILTSGFHPQAEVVQALMVVVLILVVPADTFVSLGTLLLSLPAHLHPQAWEPALCTWMGMWQSLEPSRAHQGLWPLLPGLGKLWIHHLWIWATESPGHPPLWITLDAPYTSGGLGWGHIACCEAPRWLTAAL